MSCGIYSIINKVNGKFYIGSSANIESRFKTHIRNLEKNCHINAKLQAAWNKYGKESFSFSIVEVCTQENLLMREQIYIEDSEADTRGYNINTLASGARNMLGKNLSEEHNNKLHAANIGNKYNLGRKLTKEQKEKISTKLLNSTKNRGHHLSEEHKKKISDSNKNTKVKVKETCYYCKFQSYPGPLAMHMRKHIGELPI